MSNELLTTAIINAVRQGDLLALDSWADMLEENGQGEEAEVVRVVKSFCLLNFASLPPDICFTCDGLIWGRQSRPEPTAWLDKMTEGGLSQHIVASLLKNFDLFCPLWECLARRLCFMVIEIERSAELEGGSDLIASRIFYLNKGQHIQFDPYVDFESEPEEGEDVVVTRHPIRWVPGNGEDVVRMSHPQK